MKRDVQDVKGVESMVLKKLSLDEHIRTRQLWEEIFKEDTSEFLDYYYSEKAKDNEIYVIEDNGEIVSMLETLTPRNNEIYLTDALDELSARGDLLAYVYYGDRYDVGDKFGFIKANIDFSLKSKEIGAEVKEYILELAERLK